VTAPLPTIRGRGPTSAQIVIVTDAATADDLWKGYPLAGQQGDFFAKLLHGAGILLSECYITPVIKHRIPGDSPRSLFTQTKSTANKLHLTEVLHGTYVHPTLLPAVASLQAELSLIPHRVIIALGELAMFAVSGIYGSVDTWRGSHLDSTISSATVIPTYPPAAIYKQWHVKGFCTRDLQRARAIADRPELYTYPAYSFQIRPTFPQVKSVLGSLLTQVASGQELWLSVDIETIARYISCIGIAWNVREALCIPFMSLDGHYWSEEEEVEISFLLRALLTHPLCRVIGQNFNYDNQHFAKHLGYLPNQAFDTMIAQHVLFPGIPKSLDFLSSMYCHWHRYWKDEINDYSRLPENMEQYWTYNCKDVCVTYEVAFVLQELLDHLHRRPQYDFMARTARSALRSMLRGMRIDAKSRSEVAGQLMQAISEYDALIQDIVGFQLNVGSPQQMQKFFYEELRLPLQIDKKTKRPTLNAKALATLAEKEPLLRPLVELIEKKRSLGVFLSTFCLMPLDKDGRMRCSFNVCGTETMRFSSSQNAFGSGGNLQNIPKGEEE
jgi:uracil-DNA glycosylase